MARVETRPTLASLPPPLGITADVIRGMRVNGEAPCSDQLRQAITWIGDRTLPLDTALEEAVSEGFDTRWALAALGRSGDGDGSGYGYG